MTQDLFIYSLGGINLYRFYVKHTFKNIAVKTACIFLMKENQPGYIDFCGFFFKNINLPTAKSKTKKKCFHIPQHTLSLHLSAELLVTCPENLKSS